MTPADFETYLKIARKYGVVSFKFGSHEVTLLPARPEVESQVDDSQLDPPMSPDQVAKARRESPDGLLPHERADHYASSGG